MTLADVERHAEGLVCLSGCARDGAVAARVERATTRGPRRPPGACWRPSAPTASASSSSAPTGATTAAATSSSPSWPSAWACPASPPATCTCTTRERTALQDAMVAVRLGATLDQTEPSRRGNSSHVLAPPERMAGRFSRPPEGGRRERPAGRAARLRPDRGPRLPLPRLRGPDADRGLAELCWDQGTRSATRALGPSQAPARGGAAGDPPPGPVGLFLLHRDMLELAREVACEVRGPETAAHAAAGPGRGSSVSRSCAISPASPTSTRSRTALSWALP